MGGGLSSAAGIIQRPLAAGSSPPSVAIALPFTVGEFKAQDEIAALRVKSFLLHVGSLVDNWQEHRVEVACAHDR